MDKLNHFLAIDIAGYVGTFLMVRLMISFNFMLCAFLVIVRSLTFLAGSVKRIATLLGVTTLVTRAAITRVPCTGAGLGAGLAAGVAAVFAAGLAADFAAGFADGALWCKWSVDRGATAAAFFGGATRKRICDLSGAVKPTILAYGDRQLQVWFAQDGIVRSYYSTDGGESWQGVAG